MAEENNNENKNQVIEEGKRTAKKAIMKKVAPILIKILLPFILTVLAGALLLGVFNAVGDAVQKVIDGIVDFFTIDSDGAIVISDEQVDMIINSITDLGVSIDGLKLMGDVDYSDPDVQKANQEVLRKYIREFYEAQAMTQTLNTNPSWIEENILNGGKPYGTIYVHRTLNDEEVIDSTTDTYQLEYISYDKMVELQEESKTDEIMKKFSINEKGELVIAGWKEIEVKRDGVKDNDASSKTIILKSINYKNVVSQYTTSMNFFLYLTMITQNPEFVSAVTDLVKMSDIRLTILDTKSTSVNIETYTYTQNTKTRTKVESTSYDAWDTEKQYPHTSYTYEDSTSSETITEVTETTTTSVIPTIKVTYAKTWFCEQTITYNKKQENSSNTSTITGNDSSELQNEDEPELTGEGSVSWKTNQSKKYDNTSDITKYEEGTRGDVIDRTGEKGSQGIKDKNGNGKVDGNEIVDENTTFIGLLDDKFKIPNSTRYDSAGGNLVSGAEMFFYLLQKDQSCQNLEMIMRYILYKYTGRDYGVTELDFNIFDAKDFNSISMSGNKLLKEYIHYWENAGGPPTNADGTKYIIEDDGAGHPTVGYGVDIFNGGFAPLFQQAGYPTYIGGEVDKEFVDALEEQEIQSNIDSIKSATAGLDLKEYQIHALVSRAYNCGVSGAIFVTRGSPALNFVDSYQRYWNEETDDQFEEQNNNANFGHSLYTQYMSKPVTSDGKYLAGLERRRKSEWTLFQTGYYDVLDKWYKEGGDILEMCEIVMNDLLDNNVHYSLTNLVWNNIEASNDFSRYGCCCATYVSVVIYRAGLLDADHINQYNYNYTGTVASGGVSTMLRDAGWQRISEEEAQAGDVCVYDGHTFIYAGGNEIWDQNSGCISSSGRAPVGGTLSQWSYYKNTYNLEIWRAP